jgi:hypothetical protein
MQRMPTMYVLSFEPMITVLLALVVCTSSFAVVQSFHTPVIIPCGGLGASSKVVTQQQQKCYGRPVQTVCLWAVEEEEGQKVVDGVTSPPKPAVKCPDCDLCDGSGRYVDKRSMLYATREGKS